MLEDYMVCKGTKELGTKLLLTAGVQYKYGMLKGLGLFTHLQMSYLLAEFSRGSERN
jgi:hypothetical protein